ncbi:energy coupling factor transporter S component ThiW [Guggenheimella bovis]
MNTKKLVVSGLFVAIGTLLGHLVVIPVGVAKCFPIQHTINVLSAVLLGPVYAVLNAVAISTLRVFLSTGTLLAFPGSIFGALLAGIVYKASKKKTLAAVGEVFGTGIIGAIAAFPVAKFILGKDVTTFFVLVPFLVSTIGGSIIALIILSFLKKETI